MSTQIREAVARELHVKEGGGPTPQEEFQQAAAEFKRISEEIKRFAESARGEIKETGQLSRETKEKVDEALTKQTELQARLQEVEQKLAKAEQQGSARDAGPPSAGRQMVDSEEFKALQKAGRGTARVKVISELTPSAGGVLVVPQRLPLLPLPSREYRVRDLIAPGRTSSNAIVYPQEETRVNNAGVVAEMAEKPESNITFREETALVRTIAHWIPASKQILDDVPYLESFIDNMLRDGLLDVEDLQLLKGSGVGDNISGILTTATAYAAPVVITDPTPIDILRLALLQAALTLHPPTGIVLNPVDWARIELTKTTQGSYIFTNPVVEGGRQLWGKPVVETVAMDAGDFLVGPFRTGAQVLDREDANVQVSTEDRDNFIKNMVTIRAEERLALVKYWPAAFITGTFPAPI